MAVDPGALAGANVFADRIETLVAAMLADDGVRLPGARRQGLARQAATNGLDIPDALAARIAALADGPIA